MRKNSIIECIGDTPLVLIDEKIHGISWMEIWAKCEFLNPFGSVKDRTALWLLRDAGDAEHIIESSSGNTAKALGVLSGIFGKQFLTVTNRIKQEEIEDILRIIGVEIENLPPGSECPDPNDPNSPFAVIQRKMSENPWKFYWTDQYTNPENPKIHETTTAVEIEKDLGVPDYFFGGLGTTGTTMGVAKHFSGTKMQTISIITAPKSFLPGIRNVEEMREVGLFDPELYAGHEAVDEQDAIDNMLLLIRKSGLLVGPTSGATFAWMLSFLKKQNPADLVGKKAVFIACDRLEPYTGYLREKRKSLFEDNQDFSLENPHFKGTSLYNPLFKGTSLSNPPSKGGRGVTDSAEITENLDENTGAIVIDIRSYASYEISHIKGSLSFPFEDLRKYLGQDYLPFPKESKLIFVCPFGEESVILANMAKNLGYDASSLAWWFLEFKEKFPEKII